MTSQPSSTPTAYQPNDILLGVPLVGNDNWMGGENYIRNLLYCLAALRPEERPRVRLIGVSRANPHVVNELSALDFVEIGLLDQLVSRNRLARFFLDFAYRAINRCLPRSWNIEHWKADIIYPAMDFIPGSKRPLYWIGDFQEIHLPQFFTQDRLDARWRRNRDIIESDQCLVLSSAAALDDLKANFKQVRARIHIWRFCSVLTENTDGGQDPHETYNLPRKYAYIPNQFWAHKNHETAFRALSILKRRGLTVPLVCTGSTYDFRLKEHFSSLQRLIKEAGLEDQIHLLGLVPRQNQVELVRHAAFLLQPSLFEGWSTVVEDARTMGRPIVLSNLPVHLEQNPPHAMYFDPHSPEDLADVLERAWAKFEPGPEPEAEAKAAKILSKDRLTAGRNFMAILHEAYTSRTNDLTNR